MSHHRVLHMSGTCSTHFYAGEHVQPRQCRHTIRQALLQTWPPKMQIPAILPDYIFTPPSSSSTPPRRILYHLHPTRLIQHVQAVPTDFCSSSTLPLRNPALPEICLRCPGRSICTDEAIPRGISKPHVLCLVVVVLLGLHGLEPAAGRNGQRRSWRRM